MARQYRRRRDVLWVNYPDLLRDTASHVDRLVEGATPDELPVQLPTKFELMINLKAAKALGLSCLNRYSWPPIRW